MPRLSKKAALAIFWHALERLAKKHAKDSRDDLPAGKSIQVAGTIEARVGSLSIEEMIVGELTIDHPQDSTDTTKADAVAAFAWLLDQLDETHRAAVVEAWRANKTQPAVSDEQKTAAAELLALFNVKETKQKRGDVKFKPHTAAAAA